MVKRVVLPLIGAAILVTSAIRILPLGSPLHAPTTPFDNSSAPFAARWYTLLRAASRVVPEGASVLVLSSEAEPYFHRFAMALLPKRRLLPAGVQGAASPSDLEQQAQYVILFGALPGPASGDLLLKTQDGSVWRRKLP